MPPRCTGFNEYMPQGQRTHDLEHERLLRAGWAVHAGVGLFNQKGNKFMYGTDGTCSDKLDDMSFYNILLLLSIISHTLSTPPSASGALDAATVACQKSGIYPTFDSAAGLG